MKPVNCLAWMIAIFSAVQINAQSLHIIPEPFQVTKGVGVYQLPNAITINAPKDATEVTNQMATQIGLVTGNKVEWSKRNASITLHIVKDATLGPEGYQLNVNGNGIVIQANSNAGLFYGWQTLQQIMPSAIYAKTKQANTDWQIPYVSIIDKPRFEWRGMMLDVSRHFFSKEEVKVFIDDMARYKYNRFHWHLTDDQDGELK